ncbi:hypothetical protein BCR24_11980 [Enterococcus ureilyticus]|uniref:YdhG-like domain-containing protein n=1 Tax=Enterococcus ureilyticus TaxID=1131292 RepID=A0A1E5HEU2_9ENTE|nr:DUF1801 domain-containing protein [Enterococcus ureilyticus]MBM7687426.1 hypothetical protein [Enterococcus ureilyticus]MBO0444718.1 DUF1801 domain-containing protein [Enterococcus ureilyticus]OEG23477.1 hypothetical protein BCR24_11980 [Enterococcus ureilyticus]
MKTIIDSNVANVFEGYPERYRQPLLQIRELIFSTAASLNAVGEVEESLKWNQPSYATTITKSGSPIRIDRFGAEKIALFFHCQTTLVEEFRALFGEGLEFSKNRAIVLDPDKELPINELAFCIEQALMYHKR